jgi:predicted permease
MSRRPFLGRLRRLLGRDTFEQDLDDELRFHLEMQTAKHIEHGMHPDMARALARREFGGVEFTKETVRDAQGARWVDDVVRDVRFAFRTLARAPGFVLVVLLCLGLGIGANAAIFSIVNTVLLKPLPYAEPERLLNLYETYHVAGGSGWGSVSYPNYLDWRDRSRSFTSMAAYQSASLMLRGTESNERVQALEVTSNYFGMMAVAPLRGRGFAPSDAAGVVPDEVVLNERFWRTRFGADPAIVGQTIHIGGRERTVIGIMPAAMSTRTQVWVPLALSPELAAARGSHGLAVSGRLRPGATEAAALAELQSIAEAIKREHPEEDPSRSAVVRPMIEDAIGNSGETLLVLLGAVGFVLLIACANVANLLLARSAARQQEVSVRLALGASRGRLIRQFLIESLVLAAGGAILGGAMAWFGLKALHPMVARSLPRAAELAIDGRVFLFLLGVAAIAALLFGLVPALQVTGGNLRGALTLGGMRGSTGSQSRVRNVLVVAEIALSLVLLVGAGLLLRGLLLLQSTPTGFTSTNVLTAHLTMPDTAGAGKGNFVLPLLDDIRTLPGVSAVGMISRLPIQSSGTNGNYTVPSRPAPARGQEPLAEFRWTSPGLFAALEIPVVAGRDFTPQDLRDSSNIALINTTLARREFPDVDPVGRVITLGGSTDYTIVGVVGDVRQRGLDYPTFPEIHFPARASQYARGMTLVVRAQSAPTALTQPIRDALRRADPEQALYNDMTMDEVIATSLTSRRLNLWLFGTFAAVALVLSVTGLYGVIAYLVQQRTREVGVRMALGARPVDVVVLVLRQGGTLVLLGLGIGLLGAVAMTRLIAAMLYGVSPRDPATLALVTTLLGGAALLAMLLPARRAARIDPMQAMRGE